jgi:thiamine-monophosphate kinase
MTRLRSERALGEFELIARYFSPLATSHGALGLTDDVALLRLRAGRDLVLTADAIVEDVDFLGTDPPDTVGQKALRVNLSDLAAKGAKPIGYLLTLAIPADCGASWIKAFAAGLARDQRRFKISLLGGDTTRTSGPLTVAITALGEVGSGDAILRTGARPGDHVYVTGNVGDAAVGLELLRRKRAARKGANALVSRYRLPQPRLDVGRELRRVAHAAIDISDGLVADLGHIAEVSRVRIVIDAWRVPLSVALRNHCGPMEKTQIRAATAGDDYEIAFTCSPDKAAKVRALARKSRVAITEVGRVEKGSGIALLDARGRPIRLEKRGYTHF